MQHRRVAWTFAAVTFVVLLGVSSAFIVDWRWGLGALVLSVAAFLVSIYQLQNLVADTESYINAVSYTHLTLPTKYNSCRSRWSPYH